MPSKRRFLLDLQKANGTPCHYCKRTMDICSAHRMPTRDHIHPKSQGGRRIVWACNDCNTLKADMTLDEWTLVMQAIPEWWDGISQRARDKIRNWRTGPASDRFGRPLSYPDKVYILRWGWKMWYAAKQAGITFSQPVSAAAVAAPVRWDGSQQSNSAA